MIQDVKNFPAILLLFLFIHININIYLSLTDAQCITFFPFGQFESISVEGVLIVMYVES